MQVHTNMIKKKKMSKAHTSTFFVGEELNTFKRNWILPYHWIECLNFFPWVQRFYQVCWNNIYKLKASAWPVMKQLPVCRSRWMRRWQVFNKYPQRVNSSNCRVSHSAHISSLSCADLSAALSKLNSYCKFARIRWQAFIWKITVLIYISSTIIKILIVDILIRP